MIISVHRIFLKWNYSCCLQDEIVLASICAMQFKVRMDKDFRGAFEDYLKLCKLSATRFYEPMLESVGLVSPFKDGCIENLVSELEKKI